MAALFRPRSNDIACIFVLGLLALLAGAAASAAVIGRSSYWTGVGLVVSQPVPFSHRHHVAGLGIDCRYCHTSVETSPYAGMPATETCMNCHAQLWTNAAVLEPVRRSWASNTPIAWQRVHNLPDFVYFDHSVHVTAGVGCVNCHGRVDQMALTAKAKPLHMKDCLECHRHPDAVIGPSERIFDLSWDPSAHLSAPTRPRTSDAPSSVPALRTEGLTSCSACHR